MKISRYWLQKFFEQELPNAEGISDALTFHVFEIDGIEEQGNDSILDVKVTANRGHDCLSYRGIAKELSAILELPLKDDPLAEKPDLSKKADAISVSVESDLCKRYIAGVIRGVKVGPSPKWLQERLASMGQRSINNIVDATNFVMFNVGQPLHAFDAKEVSGIIVRTARAGEKIMALDTKEYTLSDSMLVIADKTGATLGVAGVKGGKHAEVTEETTDIVLESANFDGPSVRKTAQALKLRTDASARFEQVISPELVAYGMRSVADLILKIAGGELVGFVDVYPEPQQPGTISVSTAQVRQALGDTFGEKEIEKAFTRLGFTYAKKGDAYTVTPPFERLDLTIPEDLIEEIARITGFDTIPAAPLPAFPKAPEINKNFYWSERVRQFLTERGFNEIFTSVFADQGKRQVLNKVDSDRPYLRDSVLPSMAQALEKNVRNAEFLGLLDVRLFEIGTVFMTKDEHVLLSIGVKGNKKSPKALDVLAAMAKEFGASAPKAKETNGALEVDFGAWVATLPEPSSYESLPLSTARQYQPFSKYPFIMRDIAMWMPAGHDFGEVLSVFGEYNMGLLRNAILFDQFQKDGRTSYAFHLVFQSFDRTLQDEEVNQIMQNIYDALKEKGYEIR